MRPSSKAKMPSGKDKTDVSTPARHTRSKTKLASTSSKSDNPVHEPTSNPSGLALQTSYPSTTQHAPPFSTRRPPRVERSSESDIIEIAESSHFLTPSRRISILTPPTTEHRPSKRRDRGDHASADERPDVTEAGDHEIAEGGDDDVDTNVPLERHGNANYPSRGCHAPNPWTTGHVDRSVVPDLEPHAALKAVKMFVDTEQATSNLEQARDLIAGLGRPPTWSMRSEQNVLVLVEMILPNHVVIAAEALERLERSRPDHVSADLNEGNDSQRDVPQDSVEHDIAATPRTKKTRVEAWWGRFLRLKANDISQLDPSVEEMLTQDATKTLASLYLYDTDMSTEVMQPTTERQQQILCTRILFMYNRGMADSIHIIMHIFFYAVMYHPDPDRWRVDVKACKDRSAKLSSRDIDSLYENFVDQFPEIAITRESFGIQLKEWRRLGSVYLYFARRLGLGSLLYLQDWILPSKCWGATKGGEHGGVSNKALQYLEDLGIRELCEDSGANQCVRDLLENLCQGFGTFDFGGLVS